MKDFTRLDNLLKTFVEQGTNPGCAVAVMQGDELIYHGEAGYADIEAGRKVDVHSMFSQASTTKLFTYAILGMIFEEGKKLLGRGTVAMLHENQLGPVQLADFENDYLAGYGYGLGFRTLMTQKYGHNGHIGGGTGIWVEADPVDKFSVAYMHNMAPNEELYHHHRVRAVVNGIML